MDNNDKFWRVLAVIFTIILIPLIFGSYVYTSLYSGKLVDAIIINDKQRQCDTKEIAEKLDTKTDTINRDVSNKLEVIQRDVSEIRVQIAKFIK